MLFNGSCTGRVLAVLTGLLLSSVVNAADYVFDTVHTQILFRVSHQGFSTSTGAFVDFKGGFTYDESHPEKSSVNVVIDVDSLDLNDDTWNEHVLGDKWFNVAEYPTMTFASTQVVPTGENTLDIIGDLTLLGYSKPVTLKAVVNKVGKQMGIPKAGFSATTSIDRTEWGMTTYAPLIGANVDIIIEVEGERK